jgi:hypothetical protein
MSFVFVSYSRDDSPFVQRLVRDLRHHHVPVWLDQDDIPPGVSWDDAVEEAIEKATHILVVMSKTAMASQFVRHEIHFAHGEGKKLIPVRIDDCSPILLLRGLHYIDFPDDYDDYLLKRLIDALDMPLIGDVTDPMLREKLQDIIHLPLDPAPASDAAPPVEDEPPPQLEAARLSDTAPVPPLPPEQPPTPCLVVLQSERLKRNRRFPLRENSITIGRVADCDIYLPERQVSRQHARISREGDAFYIQDLKSRNGTLVNDVAISELTELCDGDEILIASVRLRFMLHSAQSNDETDYLQTQY